ncbi:MAG: hypothetical protein ACKVOF_10195 [Pseudohongiellaceae bacterium]|jgi:hypothetical protein
MSIQNYRLALVRPVLFVILGSSLVLTPLSAQWLNTPTAGAPRIDGKVDMQAPTPRMPGNKPDFSGIWISDRTPEGEETPSSVDNLSSSRHMASMGVDLPEGLPYQPWLIPIVAERTANLAINDPHIRCLPDNFLRAYGLPHLLKFVHTADILVVLNEMNAGYRQVFTDARPLPDAPSPSWQGYSSAQWSGDTLVIDTIGVRNDTWIDWHGSVITEAAKVREEITRLDYGHLEIKVTVDDPTAYTKPWTATLKQRLVVDAELIDEICLENEQFVERMKLE